MNSIMSALNCCDVGGAWENQWTREQAEHELPGFTFKGPGWYFPAENESMLVVVTSNPLVFNFIVFNTPDPRQAIADKISAVIRNIAYPTREQFK